MSVVESNEQNNIIDLAIDLAEELYTNLKVTREFQNLIMHDFEDTEPKDEELRYIYFNSQTLGYVMFDRLLALEDTADKLVNKLFGK